MAGNIGKLVVSIGASTKGLRGGLKRAGSMVGGFAKRTGRSLKRAGGMLAGGLGVGSLLTGAGIGGMALAGSRKYSPAFQNQSAKLSYNMERIQIMLAETIGPILAKVLEAINAILQFLGLGTKAMAVFTPELMLQDFMLGRRNP